MESVEQTAPSAPVSSDPVPEGTESAPVVSDPVPEGTESEPVPDPTPAPEPEPTQPVEVVSVEELVDRLTAETAAGQEEAPAEEEVPVEEDPAAADPMEDLSAGSLDMGSGELVGMDQVLEHLGTMETTLVHPALETPFEEYTVTEGLLLLLLVLVIVSWCVKMIKGGFSWLLW